MDEYIDLADAAYGNNSDPKQPPHGWTAQVREWATWYGNGFQGGVFVSPKKSEVVVAFSGTKGGPLTCLLYTSPSPRDGLLSRMPSSA